MYYHMHFYHISLLTPLFLMRLFIIYCLWTHLSFNTFIYDISLILRLLLVNYSYNSYRKLDLHDSLNLFNQIFNKIFLALNKGDLACWERTPAYSLDYAPFLLLLLFLLLYSLGAYFYSQIEPLLQPFRSKKRFFIYYITYILCI